MPNRAHFIGVLDMRERAALIGGTLEIESSPGHRATLFLRYPLRPVAPGGQP